MQKGANLVRGWTEFQIEGASPEEFFNLCARESLGFWGARQLEPTLWRVRVSFWDWRRVEPLARRSRCRAVLLRRGGIPGLFWQIRHRYALLAGMAVSLAAVGVLSQFVLTVRVSGNVKVPTGAILSQLRAQGVRPGVFGPGLDTRQICHGVILELPQISWMAINLHGTVAEVLVREGEPRPELMEEETPAHITAKYTGIITHMDVTRGQPCVKEGDTVVAGDTLIGSWVDFVEPVGATQDMGGMLVRATGRVEARVWHTLRASIPLEGSKKVRTGREKTRWGVEILGRSWNFSLGTGIPYVKYDKMVQYYRASLPGGRALPLALRKEVCREYAQEPCPIDADAAFEMLKKELTRRLDALVGPGELLKTDWTAREAEGLFTVTLLAECRQEIGRTVED